MLLIPAIDLKNGRCVRLLQGEAAAETVYSDDPASMARSFEDAGAKRLHLVDLDGAFKGKGANLVSIRSILKIFQYQSNWAEVYVTRKILSRCLNLEFRQL